MNYIFGPVPSRRLGQSLGIDTIPLKTCNWNCVYCQLGRTRPVINERKDYFPPRAIIEEVRAALAAHPPGEIDWVTFVGSGEPLLHASMGWLIRQVKRLTDLPVAVITNGSLLYLPEVRMELAAADAVLPTLDAGSTALYQQINRPHPEISFERLIEGLVAFRNAYHGQLWLEVMLVRGLNDLPNPLWKLAERLQEIRPDVVHLNLPTRPPAETWVQPPRQESLLQAMAILGTITEVLHPANGSFDLSGYDNPVDAVVAIITRHPMQQIEIERALARWSPDEVQRVLAELKASGRAQIVQRYGVRFWSAAPAHYPKEEQSQRTMPKHPQQVQSVSVDYRGCKSDH